MRIVLYTLCWNDFPRLQFFFRHYDKFVTRYVIYDDGSDEPTLDVLRQHPNVEIRRFERSHPDSFVLSQQSISNTCWKECRDEADWVIVTDIDEHLWHPNMTAYLDQNLRKGVTVIPALGFQMIHDVVPPVTADLSDVVTRGMPWSEMMKLSIFNPKAIAEINFGVGRHNACPTGKVVLPKSDELLLLHYKYLGFSETFARHHDEFSGLGPTDIEMNWGNQYWQTVETHRKLWDHYSLHAVDYRYFSKGSHIDQFPVPRWWRWPAPWSLILPDVWLLNRSRRTEWIRRITSRKG